MSLQTNSAYADYRKRGYTNRFGIIRPLEELSSRTGNTSHPTLSHIFLWGRRPACPIMC
jgi:hypothetical protein